MEHLFQYRLSVNILLLYRHQFPVNVTPKGLVAVRTNPGGHGHPSAARSRRVCRRTRLGQTGFLRRHTGRYWPACLPVGTVRRTSGRQTIEIQLNESPDKQVSLTDPDARSMMTRGTEIVGYNVQTAVDTQHHLIVSHEVTNVGSDRDQLSSMAKQAREAMTSETLSVVADRGYFKSEEILACHDAGITAYVPKPMTSGAKADVQHEQLKLKRSPRRKNHIKKRCNESTGASIGQAIKIGFGVERITFNTDRPNTRIGNELRFRYHPQPDATHNGFT
ncbi:Transposase DDE domain-containing protein [Pseudomonas mucidolens]|uniref:Transposase DDE domain-containing protein n=1 Tax=Pseudomonas mucidolens TaxID=46679 RepID=A0A1H2NHB4_9PSED|nr:Transposase DDE domain-containing protein [Pseudomonas mucidolens]SQH31915.1 ISPsy6, transposase [Pseudomonas mucidolens]